MVRADNDNADDSDKCWLPYPGAAIMLTPEKAEQLEGTEVDKEKLRNAMADWQLIKKMKNHIEEPPTSGFFKPHHGVTAGGVLHSFGYRSDYCTQPKDLAMFGFNEAFTALGISKNEKDWCLTKITHSNWGENPVNPQVHYPPTKANFKTLFDFKSGVIVVLEAWDADYVNHRPENKHPADRLVPLKKWQDVMWLLRRTVMEQARISNAPKVEHVCWYNPPHESDKVYMLVTGLKTLTLLPKWPGLHYSTKEPQGLASLASEDAAKVCWMLIQHKGDDTARIINRFRIFSVRQGAGGNAPCLYMHTTASATYTGVQ
ncbi:hypothetical protein CBER1_10712 [Cercospora berteroae]|uniref:Uncharacterized protein n=1 Tax=Cercospora berteroae TaxID=357750 RepID=A0A2S6BYD2_9PEZI|nr:hypothetical protein CBER1_10712 [Cercospora berteroae]